MYNTPSKSRSRSKRSSDEVRSLVEWVCVVSECPGDWSIGDLGDGALLGAALRNIHKPNRLADCQGVEQVVRCISDILKVRTRRIIRNDIESEEGLADVVQLLLGYAVQCDRKQDYVAQIMTMDSSIQQHLMVEVEAALQFIAAVQKCKPSPSPFLRRKPQGDDENLEKKVSALEEELAKNKQEHLRREMEMEQEFEEERRDLCQKVETKEKDIVSLTASLETLQREAGSIQGMRDQIEVLNAQTVELSKKEDTIRKLREKLGNSNDLINQVKQLEDTNKKLLEKSLKFDEYCHQNSKLKNELEICKQAHTELQMLLGESQRDVREKQEQLDSLVADLDSVQRSEAEAVLALNHEVGTGKFDDEEENTVPEQKLGVNELNPKVREDLMFLQKENERLTAKLSDLSEENLNKLQFDLDNLGRLRIRLESDLEGKTKQWKQCKQTISEQEKTIEDLHGDMRALNIQIETLVVSHEAELCSHSIVGELVSRIELDTARAEANAYRRDHATSNEQLVLITAELDESSRKVALLDKKLEDARTTIVELEESQENTILSSQAEIESLEALLGERKTELEDLQARFSEERLVLENQLCKEREHVKECKQRLNDERDQLSNDMLTLQTKHEDEKRGLAESAQELEGEICRLKAEVKESREELTTMQDHLAQGKVQFDSVVCKLKLAESQNLSAQEALERKRLEMNECQLQIKQLRKQLRAVQVQRSQAAQRQTVESEQQEMMEEMQRLHQQLSTVEKENQELRKGRTVMIDPKAGGKGLSEMMKNYERQITELMEEATTLRMDKTNALTSRKEIEVKCQKLSKEKEEYVAENTTLRLKLERLRMTAAAPTTPVVYESVKENKTPNTVASQGLDDNLKEEDCKQQ
uniref:Calponin-homology (CH) domain-containing protein n=1 Tax=Mucochytrium quahogii TaxID=96639 RepID=A0A7S2RI54_9STRA|mmetsp:Transcript_40375/g.65058  ORF Transcript_40375/g.65058 Transcript_40375/m.65058 type:complete len:876 (-) Transcript_40375:39-2666(-)